MNDDNGHHKDNNNENDDDDDDNVIFIDHHHIMLCDSWRWSYGWLRNMDNWNIWKESSFKLRTKI